MRTILNKLKIRILNEVYEPTHLLTTDNDGNIAKVPVSTSNENNSSGGCCRTIDGGAPDTVYLPTQNLDGGAPDSVGANNHVDGGYFEL